jgi:hypothetical protein
MESKLLTEPVQNEGNLNIQYPATNTQPKKFGFKYLTFNVGRSTFDVRYSESCICGTKRRRTLKKRQKKTPVKDEGVFL